MATGDDAWWAAVMLLGAPGAVRNLRDTARTRNTITWQFEAPQSGGPITRYEYRSALDSASFSGAWISLGTNRQIRLTGLTPQILYKVQVRAVGPAGTGPATEDSASTVAMAPSKPTGFTVTATGRAFRLRASVDNGGAAITKWQYRIATTSGGVASASWTDIAGSASSSLDFTTGNIGNSVTRFFQVRAVNAIDNGASSDIDSATTGAAITTDTDTIWRRATSTPDAPSGGTNSENHTPSPWQRTQPVPTATENVYRARRTRTYADGTFRSATNWGNVTKVADRTGPVLSEPGKPTNFRATVSGQSVRLRASVDNGNSAITKWQYRSAGTAGGLSSATWGDFATSASSSLDETVTQAYSRTVHYEVRAVNAIGNGPASDSVSATTGARPVTRPGAVTNLAAAQSGTSLVVSYGSPASGDTPTRYEYRTKLTSGDFGSWISNALNLTFTLSSLTAGSSYTIEVRAVNAGGDGPESSVVSGIRGWDSGLAIPSAAHNIHALAVQSDGAIVMVAEDTSGRDDLYFHDGSSWSSAIDLPVNTSVVVRVAVAPNDDVLVAVGTADLIYRYSGGSWDSGLSIPGAVHNIHALAVQSDGAIVMVAEDTSGRDDLYFHDGSSWSSAIDLPVNTSVVVRVAVAPNDDVLVAVGTADLIYRYSGGSWDSGLSIPGAAHNIHALAVQSDGAIVMVAEDTSGRDDLYFHDGSSWSSAIDLPVNTSVVARVAVAPNDDVLVAVGTADLIYRYGLS